MADNEKRVQAWQKEIAEKKTLRDELFCKQNSLLEELESYARIMGFMSTTYTTGNGSRVEMTMYAVRTIGIKTCWHIREN